MTTKDNTQCDTFVNETEVNQETPFIPHDFVIIHFKDRSLRFDDKSIRYMFKNSEVSIELEAEQFIGMLQVPKDYDNYFNDSVSVILYDLENLCTTWGYKKLMSCVERYNKRILEQYEKREHERKKEAAEKKHRKEEINRQQTHASNNPFGNFQNFMNAFSNR